VITAVDFLQRQWVGRKFIFNGKGTTPEFRDEVPPGTVVELSEWCIISELCYRLASAPSYLLDALLFSWVVTALNNEAAQRQTIANFYTYHHTPERGLQYFDCVETVFLLLL
jgi:hypothetical protein